MESHRLQKIVPILLFVTLAGAFIGASAYERDREREELQVHLDMAVVQVVGRLEECLASRLALTEELAHDWAAGFIDEPRRFVRRAQDMLARDPALLAINWVDPNGVIRWAVPDPRHSAARDENRSDGIPAAGFLAPDAPPRTRVTPPMALAEGGRGLAGWVPIVRDGTVQGYLNPVIRLDPLMEACFTDSLRDKFHIAVLDGTQVVYGDAASLDTGISPVRRSAAVGDRTWTILVSAEPGRIADIELPLGLAFAAGLAAGAYVLLRRQSRLRDSLLRLEASESRYRQLVEHAPLGIATLDASTTVTSVNPAHVRLMGAPDAAAIIGHRGSYFPVATDPAASGAIQECILTGEPQTAEVTLDTRWGHRADLRLNFARLHDPATGTSGLLMLSEDIHDRVKAERELRRRVELEQLIARVSAGFVNLGPEDLDAGIEQALDSIGEFVGADRCSVTELAADGQVASVTYQWCAPGVPWTRAYLQHITMEQFPWLIRRLGRTDVLVGTNLDDLPADAAADRWMLELVGMRSFASVPMVVGGRAIGHLQVTLTRGETAWAGDTIFMLTVVAEMLGNALQRRRIERALRESEEELRLTFTHAAVGIAHVDPTGRFLRANPRLCEMLGYTEAELRDRTAFDLTHPDDGDMSVEDAEAAWRGDIATYGIEKRMLHKSGAVVWVRITVSLARTAEGEPRYFIGIYEDMSEQKRAVAERRALERQVQHAQKLESLGVLAGGIAHDFNNLLMGVLGNAGVALLELPPSASARSAVQAIETAALRAADLTKQLLAYSGKGTFIIAPLDMNALATEMRQLLGTVISKKAELSSDLPFGLPAVNGDATQLRQVVMNLITNASDALGDAPGRITMRTGVMDADRAYLAETSLGPDLPEGRYVYFEVEDTGCGMDAETRARMFDPFYTTKFTGRGLGLAAVLGIVRAHEGALRVESQPGRGTTFRVLLPVSAQHAVLGDPGPEGDAPCDGGGIVLVVDDEEPVRDVVERILSGNGFGVVTAADGREALDLFERGDGEIAAVLLDLTMPRMGGVETFRELHRLRPDVRVIFTSGYSERDVTNGFDGLQPAGFLQKPYRATQLLAKLREVLAA